MSNPRLIKKRVGSVKNINKITKALEMVSASKVTKAQDKAQNAKPYSQKIYDLMQSLAPYAAKNLSPLLALPETNNSPLFVIISSNRGLAGSLNTNLFRHLATATSGQKNNFITVGKKGINFAVSTGKLLGDFSDYSPPESSIVPLVKLITDSFTSKEVDSVHLVYSEYISALTQKPKVRNLLPIKKQKAEDLPSESDQIYNFEPTPEEVLIDLIPFYLEVVISEAFFQAQASEHSARMVAMKSASDNAKNLTDALSLEYNKARQQLVTTELGDIVTAGLSLEK